MTSAAPANSWGPDNVGSCLLLNDGTWRVDADPDVLMMLKRVFPGETRKSHGHVRMADTEENCRNLLWFISRYPLETDPADRLIEQAKRHRERTSLVRALLAGRLKAPEFELALPAREYQRVAADMLLRSKKLLLADEMGLGKTISAIATFTDARTLPALVVTMTSLPRQWQDQIARFAPKLKTHILTVTTPYDLTKRTGSLPDVIITNYHKLAGWADTLGAGVVRSVTFDEVQELRHEGTDRYEAAKYIASKCEFRHGLSGTPIYNWGIEIWNIMEILNPGGLGTRREFIEEWCVRDEGSDKARIKDPKAFGSFARKNGWILRRTRIDVARELPPISRHHQIVDCNKSALDDIAGSAVELAKIILTQKETVRGEKMQASEELSNKLRQATGIGKAPYVAHFVRMLVESGEQVVLYAWHHAVYDLYRQFFDVEPKIPFVSFTGKESPKQKEAAKQAFLAGDAKVLIMSLRAGAGLDGLQGKCRTVVFGELDWSFGVHDQCETRVYRDGQALPTFVYYLISETGSDPIVADVLGLKKVQLLGIRDPDLKAFGPIQSGEANAKRLAEAFLKQRGIKPPPSKPPRAA